MQIGTTSVLLYLFVFLLFLLPALMLSLEITRLCWKGVDSVAPLSHFLPFPIKYDVGYRFVIYNLYWTIPTSMGWSLLGHGEWPFWYVVGFGLPLVYWWFLHHIL
jgi:hypothetical protein